jgi:hypothetical protein
MLQNADMSRYRLPCLVSPKRREILSALRLISEGRNLDAGLMLAHI